MDAQQIPIHCTYAEDVGIDISDIILASLRVFVQAELQAKDTHNFESSTAE